MNNSLPLALVTGAGQGIGEAIACRLLDDGMRVIALDLAADRLTALQENRTQQPLIPCQFDLSQIKKIAALVADLAAEHGPITRLVNNAGNWASGRIVELSDEHWDKIFQVNLTRPLP
jgi:3-oxoacyl-[acyl-carrier protein] reductase